MSEHIDEYTAFLEAQFAKFKTGHCPNCEAAIRPLHCCACEGCDGCRELVATPPTNPSDAAMRAAEEIAGFCEHESHCASNERYPSPECDCGLNGKITAIITRHLAATTNNAEREFLAASIAVWREIDRLSALPEGYKGLPPETDLRKRELAAWEKYRSVLDSATATTSPETPVGGEACTNCGGSGEIEIGCAMDHALTAKCVECGGTGRIAQSAAPVVATGDDEGDVISRAALLKDLEGSHATCIANANNEARPETYRKMMEHYAEAGRQIIERVEKFPPLVLE